MTEHEIRTILEDSRKAKREVEFIKREIEEVETMIMSITIDYSRPRVQTSIDSDKLASMIDRLTLIRSKCIDQHQEAIDKMAQAKELIDKVQNVLARDVMSRRYLLGQKWEVIAYEIPIDYSYNFKLRDEGVKEIANFY